MLIKIESNGEPSGSKVTNAETGEVIKGVQHVSIEITPESTTATVIFSRFYLDVIAEANSQKIIDLSKTD